MINASGMIIFFLLFFVGSSHHSFSAPKGKKTSVTFDRALPEDISNENFPDKIESFDFPDATLLDLVKAISKLTGVNFIVDPALQGKKISIIAPSSITVAEAYKAFLSALAANSYTIIKSGAFWKIQTIEKAHKDNTKVYSGDYFPNTDQLITRIIKLKHINAKNFTTSIKWLLSQDNKISTHESTNSIILSDYGSVIERIMKIVYEMDVPGSEEKIKIIQIEHASAEILADMLRELLSIGSRPRGSSYISRSSRKTRINLSPSVKKAGGTLKISSIIPDARTNSLVISANEEGVKRIRNLVNKLDTPVDASRMGGVYVYNVLYGTADEVYNTLMGIKPSESKSDRTPRFGQFPPLPRRGGSRTSRPSSESPLFENVTIMADTNTNSLIISAKNKYDYERVKAVLQKIDVPRDQVFIQAIIVEMIINKDDNREINLARSLGKIFESVFGADYYFKDVLGASIGGFLNRPFDIASLPKAQFGPGLILGATLPNLLKDVFSQDTSFGLKNTFSKDPEFKKLPIDKRTQLFDTALRSDSVTQVLETSIIPLIRLLKTVANVNVLSTPQLTTLDNVPAFIEVGENAPVGLTSTATTGALSQSSIDRKDITLRLDIVPRINPESRTVQMDIKQKFDDFSNRSSSASELASKGVHIIKRNIQTKMVLNDGETAVLGGLLIDKETQTENKVPLLGDIPVLGWLFKGSNIEKEKRNLLVFITPTIIKGEEQKEKTKEILGKKLEERIRFVKKYMKGRDPHGEILKSLIPESEAILDSKKKEKKKRRWFWQKESPTENLFLDQKSEETNIESYNEEFSPEAPVEFEGPEESFSEDEGDFSYPELLDDHQEPFLEEEEYEEDEEGDEEKEEEEEEEEENNNEEEILLKQSDEKDDESENLNSEETLNNKEDDFIPLPPESLGF